MPAVLDLVVVRYASLRRDEFVADQHFFGSGTLVLMLLAREVRLAAFVLALSLAISRILVNHRGVGRLAVVAHSVLEFHFLLSVSQSVLYFIGEVVVVEEVVCGLGLRWSTASLRVLLQSAVQLVV